MEQFLNNKRFPGAIVKYLEGTKMENLAGDAFILLLNVMTEDTFNVVTDKFIKNLLSALDFINDEDT